MTRKITALLGLFLLLVLPISGGTGTSRASRHSLRDGVVSLRFPTALPPDAIAEHVPGQSPTAAESELEAERRLFVDTPAGWNLDTIRFLYGWTASLPKKIPDFIQYAMEQGRLVGVLGSVLLIVFSAAVLYGLFGQKRVLRKVKEELQPLWERFPALSRPYFLSLIRVLVSSLLPVLLLGVFLLIEDIIHSKVAWFLLIEKLLGLWAAGALVGGLLWETFMGGLLPFCPRYGKNLFRSLRLVLICLAAGIAIVWGAEALQPRADVLAFSKFAVSLIIVFILSSILLKKTTLLSLLPVIPNRGYAGFVRFLDRFYTPLVLVTFLAGILWCFGYRRLSAAIWIKTWGVAGAYVLTMISYHTLSQHLRKLSEREDHLRDEAARFFFQSARTFLRYAAAAVASLIILHLLGFLAPLYYAVSVPVYTIGETPISFWVIFEAGAILFAFIYASRLLQAYLDYKIYPFAGVDTGLAYALNTFLRYLFLTAGFVCALRVVGLDLRVLMVFAGAVGIGTGLGLQNITANLISGFILVFGRKLRKGDWIKVGDKLGMVTHIYLRATRVWTRDNIEYIVPNTDFISKQIVNYTLTSPIVRVFIPVGVSYDTSPLEARKILLAIAEQQPMVMQHRKPEVRIARFGDNSIDLELLVWIDISKIAEKDIRSRLYYSIFEAFSEAGIELPVPQRDIHIRSGPQPKVGLCTGSDRDPVFCRAT